MVSAPDAPFAEPPGAPEAGGPGVALAPHFLGAEPAIQIERREKVANHFTHLIDADPDGSRRNLPGRREVVYRGLWPGISVPDAGDLRIEVLVRPAAVPPAVRLAYTGVEGLVVTMDT